MAHGPDSPAIPSMYMQFRLFSHLSSLMLKELSSSFRYGGIWGVLLLLFFQIIIGSFLLNQLLCLASISCHYNIALNNPNRIFWFMHRSSTSTSRNYTTSPKLSSNSSATISSTITNGDSNSNSGYMLNNSTSGNRSAWTLNNIKLD